MLTSSTSFAPPKYEFCAIIIYYPIHHCQSIGRSITSLLLSCKRRNFRSERANILITANVEIVSREVDRTVVRIRYARNATVGSILTSFRFPHTCRSCLRFRRCYTNRKRSSSRENTVDCSRPSRNITHIHHRPNDWSCIHIFRQNRRKIRERISSGVQGFPCHTFRCPANNMGIPFQTIYKAHIHGYGNHYSKKSGKFMLLRWICRALRDRQNQSQGLDFAINFADGKVILHRACFLNTLTVCLLCQHPAPSPGWEAALLLFSPFFNLRSCKYPLHSFLHLAIMKELLLKPEWLFLRPR